MSTYPCPCCHRFVGPGDLVRQLVTRGPGVWHGVTRFPMCRECAGRVRDGLEMRVMAVAMLMMIAGVLYLGLGYPMPSFLAGLSGRP